MPLDISSIVNEANYPCSRQELVDYAREQGADETVVRSLQNLDRAQFSSPTDVSDAFNGA